MAKEYGYGQLKHGDRAWSHARGTGAPPIVKSHERAHSKAMDPSRGPAPDRGQTKGGSRQGGKRGGKD